MTRTSDGRRQSLPPQLRPYLAELVRRTRDVCGDGLVSVHAVGSVALGDYRHGRSDADVAVVVQPGQPAGVLRELAAVLAHPRLPCPAAGLELVVYAADFAARPSGDAGYLLDLNTGPLLPDKADTDASRAPAFWYVIDRSVARQAGVALSGPPAETVFAAPGRGVLLEAVAASVREHSDGEGHLADNRVLNGCRAVVFARTGRWRAKRAAAAEVVAAEPQFASLVQAAVDSFEQPRGSAVPLQARQVRHFLDWVSERVGEAARTGHH